MVSSIIPAPVTPLPNTPTAQYKQELTRAKHDLLKCHRRFFQKFLCPEGSGRSGQFGSSAHSDAKTELTIVLSSTLSWPTDEKKEVRRYAFNQYIAETMLQVRNLKEREDIFWRQMTAMITLAHKGMDDMWCAQGFDHFRRAIETTAAENKASANPEGPTGSSALPTGGRTMLATRQRRSSPTTIPRGAAQPEYPGCSGHHSLIPGRPAVGDMRPPKLAPRW
jgi:hypothetical protein